MDSPKYNLKRIARYMRNNAGDHLDRRTGEYNMTALAEDAAQHFDLYAGDDVPEELFDVAYEVVIALEKR
ncbi:MAG: hypothetical protein JXA21_11295 [Anaerolineae bacterium]|nr:hypothetical protein [Anaerolineae bacterium]